MTTIKTRWLALLLMTATGCAVLMALVTTRWWSLKTLEQQNALAATSARLLKV